MLKILVSLLLSIGSINTGILSSSKVEKCYTQDTDGSNFTSQANTNCKEKLVIALSLDNGQLSGSESIEYNLSSLGTGINNITYYFEQPIVLRVSKSKVQAIYKLKYLQDFNSKPEEIYIETSLFSCEDGFYSNSPTCGFAFNSKGEKILDSQGFCCSCSIEQFLGIDTSTLKRAKQCSALNLGKGVSTAHCLRFNELWYSAFEIASPQLDYEIYVETSFNNTNDVRQSEKVTIGSSVRAVNSSNGNLLVKLIGDFSPLVQPQDYSDNVLLKPSFPYTHPRIIEGPINWMIVPKSQLTMDGTECNKIGVSYSAFAHESDSCKKPVGSCLKNQIEDLFQSDLSRLNSGLNGNYLLNSKGNFQAWIDYKKNVTSLSLEIDGTQTSLITLELKTDNLKFTTNLGVGSIDYLYIKDFEALSGNGKMLTQITNKGKLTSEYHTKINCTSLILPLPSRTVYLEAGASAQLNFDIETKSSNNLNHSCLLILTDATGTEIDRKKVNFSTSQTNFTSAQPESGLASNPSDSKQQSFQNSPSCDEICPSMYDIICSLGNKCTSKILKFLAVILGSSISIVLCGCLVKRKGILCCCKYIMQKRKEAVKKKKRTFEPDYKFDRRIKTADFEASNRFNYGDKSIYSNKFSKNILGDLFEGEECKENPIPLYALPSNRGNFSNYEDLRKNKSNLHLKTMYINMSHRKGLGQRICLDFSLSFEIFQDLSKNNFFIDEHCPFLFLIEEKFPNLKDSFLKLMIPFCIRNRDQGYLTEYPLYRILKQHLSTL